MIKPRPRNCPICRQPYMPRNSLQKVCFDLDCALAHARRQTDRKAKREAAQKRRTERLERKLHREARERVKTAQELRAYHQRYVNQYVNLRDAGKPCISCGDPKPTDAGHLFHAGTKYRLAEMTMDSDFIHRQCAKCNRYSGGMTGDMRAGILTRYGQAYLDRLDATKRMTDRGEIPKLTRARIMEISEFYRAEIKRLKNTCAPS